MRRQTRSRKVIFWGLVSFVAMQLALIALLTWGPWDFLRDPAYGYKAALLRHRLAQADRPCTVILLGSSRTMPAVDPLVLEPLLVEQLQRPVVAFNFAMPGRGPASHELYLRRLLRQGSRPDLLLVEIHPLYLAGQAPQTDLQEHFLPASWLLWEELALVEAYAGPQRPHVRLDWLNSWALPACGHRVALLTYLAPRWVPAHFKQFNFGDFEPSGYLLFHRSELMMTAQERRAALNHAREEYRDQYQGFRLGEAQCQGLRRIAALCRQEGITLAWLVSPEGPVFRSWYPPGGREQVLDFLTRLSAETGTAVIDATYWLPEEDFNDSHHPVRTATPRYTARLAREGILPLLPGRAGRYVHSRPD